MNKNDSEDLEPKDETVSRMDSSIPGLSTNFSGIDDDGPAERASNLESVGPYQIISPIGEGGMGTVYLAEQTSPIKREVALKIIKAVRSSSKQIISRFEAERQAVALMEHPNIAKVFDAGTTQEGAPFFAMELVRGVPFTEYCDEHKLSIRERLELFVPVCRAVQHAHQKGVIHRDLKPSNVLIGLIDEKPVPKVIDFGLAKATKQREHLIENSLQTQFGQIVGTPQYMSPEQASTEHDDIDTRTDVYSLGVMLFELLTGSTPLAAEALKKNHLIKILELIRDGENPRPSTRLGDSADTISSISSSRKISPNQLQQVLRGELDWIVMKALEKDRDRRYQSSNELAEDIKRFLNDEPVEARPPSASYLVQKFVKKNKGLVASLATVFGLLVVAVSVVSYFAIAAANSAEQAEIEKENAEDSADRYAGVLDVIKGSFRSISPENGGDPNMMASDVLLLAKESVGDSRLDTEGQIELFDTLHECFLGVGDFKEAVATAELAFELCGESIPGEEDYYVAMHNLALALQMNGDYDRAFKLESEASKELVKLLGEEHEKAIQCLAGKANILNRLGRFDEAIELGQKSVSLHQKVHGQSDRRTLAAQHNLGVTFMSADQYKEAQRVFESVFERRKEAFGAEALDTLVTRSALANSRLRQGDAVGTIEDLETTQQKLEKGYGEDHPSVLINLLHLAKAKRMTGKVDESVELLTSGFRKLQVEQRQNHPLTLIMMNDLAFALREANQLDEATVLFEKVVKLQREELGEIHPDVLKAILNLSISYNFQQRYEKIVQLLGESNSLIEETAPDSDAALGTTRDLAVAQMKLNRFDKALPLFVKTTKRLGEQYGEQTLAFQMMNLNLGRCYEATGELKKAIECFQACFEYSKTDRRVPPSMVGYLYRTCLVEGEHDKLTDALEYKVAEAIQLGGVAAIPTLGNAADYFAKMKNYSRAGAVLKEALDLCKANNQEVIGAQMMKVGYGWMLLQKGELEEAETWMQDGLEGLKAASDQVPPRTFQAMMRDANQKYDDLRKAKSAAGDE